MANPAPVTLAEFREHLNLDESDVTSDEELWATLLAAVGKVESLAGAMRIREVTERVVVSSRYDGWTPLPLTQWPVIGSPSATDVSGVLNSFAWELNYGTRFAYDVTYMVGREPIPEALMLATMIIGRQLYDTQRNAPAVTFTGMGGQETMTPMGFAVPRRAEQLLSDFMVPAIA